MIAMIAKVIAATASTSRATFAQSVGELPNTTSGRWPCTIARYGRPR